MNGAYPMLWQHWLAAFGLFAAFYFGLTQPLAQRLSVRLRGRRFTIRLGTPWNVRDPEQRWDVLYSVASFMLALALSMAAFELCIRLGWLPPAGKIGAAPP